MITSHENQEYKIQYVVLGPRVFQIIFALNKIRPKTKVYDSVLIITLSYDEVSAFLLLYKARYSSLLTGRYICLS